MAEILPFPASRRVDLVQHCAQTMARLDCDDSESHLLRTAEAEFRRLVRLGVDWKVSEDAVVAFASAVRAELWRYVFSKPGGVA